jgi:hypothetical protein
VSAGRLTDEQLDSMGQWAAFDLGAKEGAEVMALIDEARANRAILAELREQLERPCNATAVAGIAPGKGFPLTEHVRRIQARLSLDHDEKCSVVVRNLQLAREEVARLKPMDAPGMRFERPAVETWEEP